MAEPLAPAGGVLAAFWDYERALMANDLEALDRLFAPGDATLRGDVGGILVGHDAISAFRQGRGGAPTRRIVEVVVTPIADDAALVIAITEPATGGRGQQTQLWRLVDGAWTVAAAHVALPAPAVNSSIWRTVGTPLVAGSTEAGSTGAGSTGAGSTGAGLPLAGQTVAVKDLFAIAGHAVGGGVPAYLAESPAAETTAPAVSALLAAGASVTGIARTDEFAYSIAGRNPHYGTPPNPVVVGAIPGGSSSGPASAVSSGQASIGLGTDTGGSIRVPSSYQGLWGLRTTHSAVSVEGLLPLAPSFDTVGWLTRDAATLRAAAAVSLEPALGVDLAPGFVVFPGFSPHIEPEVRDAFHAALQSASAAGPIDVIDLGDLDELFEIFRTVQAAEAWSTHGEWITDHPGALGEEIAARFAWAASVDSATEAAARAALATVRERLDGALGDRVLLLPAASSVAPPATADAATIERTRAGTLRLTCIAGLTGRPALSAPLMTVPRAGQLTPAPVGLCFVGPRGSDLALVDLASRIAESLA